MLQIHSINWKGGQYLLRFWNLSPMRLKFLCPIIGNYLYSICHFYSKDSWHTICFLHLHSSVPTTDWQPKITINAHTTSGQLHQQSNTTASILPFISNIIQKYTTGHSCPTHNFGTTPYSRHDINLQLKAPWLEWVMTVGETESVMMLRDQQIICGTRWVTTCLGFGRLRRRWEKNWKIAMNLSHPKVTFLF